MLGRSGSRLDNTLNGPGYLRLLQREVRWEGFQDETLSFQQDKAGPHRYMHVEVEEWHQTVLICPIENLRAFIKDEP